MDSVRVASTPLLGLEPLGNLGDRSHATLTRVLAQLGDDCRTLLAEPVPSQAGARIDWYAEGAERPVRVSDLPPEAREKALADFAGIAERVNARAAEVEEADPALAHALRNALVVPDEGHVYLLGDRIVLVAWAYRQSGMPGYGGPPTAVIAPATPITPAVAVVPATVVASRSWAAWFLAFLLWLLFIAIVSTIYWLSLNACGISSIFWSDSSACPQQIEPLSPAQAEQAEAIAARIRQLESDIEAKRVACDVCRREEPAPLPPPPEPTPPVPTPKPETPPEPPPEPQPEPEPEPQDDIQNRLDEAGAEEGDVQVSLAWDSHADLDLVIECPSGERIYFRNKAACGGTLDVDMNSVDGPATTERPVENIYFVDQGMPNGPYRVGVLLYNRRGDMRPQIPFTVRIKTENGVETRSGTVSNEMELSPVYMFDH